MRKDLNLIVRLNVDDNDPYVNEHYDEFVLLLVIIDLSINLSNVDFPAPFGPTNARRVSRSILKIGDLYKSNPSMKILKMEK